MASALPSDSANPLAPPPVDPANADLPQQLDDSALATPQQASRELALLRQRQRLALDCLMQGLTYTEAARIAGVVRRTLYRWTREDPQFQRAMDSWRGCAMRSAEDRLLRGAEVAASTLSAAAARDYRAAAILLKGRGLLTPPPAAPIPKTDPSAARTFLQSIPPDKRQAFEMQLRELILSFSERPEGSAAQLAGEAEGSEECLR